MTGFKNILLGSLMLFFAPLMSAPAHAHTFVTPAIVADEHDEALKAIKRGEIMPYARLKKAVQKSLNGRVVGERLRKTNRGWVYEMRIRRKNGRVIFAIVDAKTAAVISTSNQKNN